MTDKQNKPFYKRTWFRVGLGLTLIASLSLRVYFETNTIKVNKVRFRSNKLPEGFQLNVVQLTDLHNKEFPNRNQKLLEAIQQAEADFIVITGDWIDRKTVDTSNALRLVDQMKAIHDHVYYVTGNHEWENALFSHFMDDLAERGVVILHNEHAVLTVRGVDIQIVGIDDASTNHENLVTAFESIDENLYTIFLSHSPVVTKRSPNVSADLVLSGHTHGGQVRFPFIGALIAPDDGLFPTLDKGIFPLGDDRYLYIDSGLGTTGAPMRLLNQSQISLIEIDPVHD
ncbi:metallophosphoesterase [Halalkalibacter hemicellulosilyticus]|uniref:Phosphohydrolase n=1 Tax=Halalkalibacter hemicellulosilyticusJCM 9152 TaxID=1236971 RepID=W4QIM7_9BACI|nr:metallophosphoesterase [Halalkalibacter hemicellulosilyticus]GAE31965.1 phosphohydrolase [Halalkalibacter hemicellulosilyticusJCM 9152]